MDASRKADDIFYSKTKLTLDVTMDRMIELMKTVYRTWVSEGLVERTAP